MNEHEKINYVEFPAKDLSATKAFFSEVFGWSFEDFGPEYSAFFQPCLDEGKKGIEGGFFKSDLQSSTSNGAVLIVFYSQDLEGTKAKIEQAGGVIINPIFSFPGGRRFHFSEPSGNEFAVWSDM